MKSIFNIRIIAPTLLYILFATPSMAQQRDYFKYVSTMIGTGAHYSADAAGLWGTVRKQKPIPTSKLGTMAGYDQAHDPGQCIPAVLTPHGMNFWVAQTEDTEQKEISPYYYKDEEIQGFRNSHFIVGGMTQDYGTFTIMPLGTDLIKNPIERGSKYSHAEEISTPSYYSVQLQRYGIKAEMTATSRSAIFRFTYRDAGDVYLVVNPNSDEGLGRIAYNPETHEITGSNPAHRIYQGWGEYAGFDGHFTVQINKPIIEGGVYAGDSILALGTMSINTPNDGRAFPKGFVPAKNVHEVGAYVKFHVEAGETVIVKAASSFTDIAHAKDNLSKEIPAWDFDGLHTSLTKTWQQTLGRIDVQSNDNELLTNFYTALYHASFLPHALNDVDGSYPSYAGGKEICHTDGVYYDDFSMWDTYRALHPLLNIIAPEQSGNMMQSLINKYEQGGWLPIFPCWNSYTSEMIGDHCASLMADAYLKGVRNFDIKKAYKALRKNAFETPATYNEYKDGKGRRALTSYLKYGYIPLEDSVKEAFHTGEQVSRTMEYAYDDYALAELAKNLGHNDDYKELMRRSKFYQNVIDPQTGYAQGRHAPSTDSGQADGKFLTDNNMFSFCKFITEGQPCHYTWYVPHDPQGLMKCVGGRNAYIAKLDTLFNGKHYWHGNEPCHQIAFMYDYAGQPWKTQQQVRHIMTTEYNTGADGLAGNDDAGQMSAWYIFASLGFYPVCPPSCQYMIASPAFSKAVIHMASGKNFTLTAQNASPKNIYIQSVTLNGKPYNRNYITHEEIADGGTMKFVMGPKPNKKWGSK